MENNPENNQIDSTVNNTENGPEVISRKLIVFDAVVLVLVVFMVFTIYSMFSSPKGSVAKSDEIEEATASAFDAVELTGKSAYVYDVSLNKVIFKKDEFVQLPLASITKLMTALVATDILPANSKITINQDFLSAEGDSGLLVDETWTLKDLLDFSLVVSSNDGARSVASVVGAFDVNSKDYDLGRKDFIKRMNVKAQELGLKQTYFVNESGLDIGSVSGGYGSAIDVAKLMKYIIINKPQLLEATKYPTTTVNSFSESHTVKNTNTDIGEIPGLIASKTGYTELAGGNLVVAFDASIGRPMIVVVLGSTAEGRFQDVTNLVNASLEYIRE